MKKILITGTSGFIASFLYKKFEGDGYIYWFDKDLNTNRQFEGLENNYTIETWFRSVSLTEQTMFSAVDSASENNYLNIGLTSEGYVSWTHNNLTILSAEKFAGSGHAVNVTLGLPIIRTSVDHGTAFDLANSENIDSSSLIAAIKLAKNLVANRC